jgi:hypothetical protein
MQGGGTLRKQKHVFVASLDLDAMVAGNAGGGRTCYESALSPDPAQAKLQAEAFWRRKRSSSEFWERRGGHHFLVIHILTTSNNAGRIQSSVLQCLPDAYDARRTLHIPTSRGRRAKKIRGTDLLWNDIAARW